MSFIEKLLKYAPNSPGSLWIALTNEYTPTYIGDRPVTRSEMNELLSGTANVERTEYGN
jgi:hypothetical protein